MYAGDFVGLVQLGVVIHIGSALLQVYGEVGIQPVERRLQRLRSAYDINADCGSSLGDELTELEGDFEIFRINFYNEYRTLIVINTFVAAALVLILVVISFNSAHKMTWATAVGITAVATLPGPYTLFILWRAYARDSGGPTC
jgi:hypothetical protein